MQLSRPDMVRCVAALPMASTRSRAFPMRRRRLAPIGSEPPQPVEPWSGVRDALTYGPKSPQLPYPPPIDMLLPELAVAR